MRGPKRHQLDEVLANCREFVRDDTIAYWEIAGI